MSAEPLSVQAVRACRDFEGWTREVEELTAEIAECWCPNEPGPHRDPEWIDGEVPPMDAPQSCFQRERSVVVSTGAVYSEPRGPRTIDEVRAAVSDCPACSRLCDLIAERKRARMRVGVAKRLIRHAGKRAVAIAMEGAQ